MHHSPCAKNAKLPSKDTGGHHGVVWCADPHGTHPISQQLRHSDLYNGIQRGLLPRRVRDGGLGGDGRQGTGGGHPTHAATVPPGEQLLAWPLLHDDVTRVSVLSEDSRSCGAAGRGVTPAWGSNRGRGRTGTGEGSYVPLTADTGKRRATLRSVDGVAWGRRHVGHCNCDINATVQVPANGTHDATRQNMAPPMEGSRLKVNVHAQRRRFRQWRHNTSTAGPITAISSLHITVKFQGECRRIVADAVAQRAATRAPT